MSDEVRVRVTDGETFVFDGEIHRGGDELTITAVRADRHPYTLELVADSSICGVEMSDGSTCERPADECPYHDGDN